MRSLNVKFDPPNPIQMRPRKMASFSLEVVQSLMLVAVHLGGERRMLEIQKSVCTIHLMVFDSLRSIT
jgi:hypothetical protein